MARNGYLVPTVINTWLPLITPTDTPAARVVRIINTSGVNMQVAINGNFTDFDTLEPGESESYGGPYAGNQGGITNLQVRTVSAAGTVRWKSTF